MKPGYKTTEFWVTLVVVLAGAFVASGIVPEDEPWVRFVSLAVAGLSALGYTAGRSKAKAGQ